MSAAGAVERSAAIQLNLALCHMLTLIQLLC